MECKIDRWAESRNRGRGVVTGVELCRGGMRLMANGSWGNVRGLPVRFPPRAGRVGGGRGAGGPGSRAAC